MVKFVPLLDSAYHEISKQIRNQLFTSDENSDFVKFVTAQVNKENTSVKDKDKYHSNVIANQVPIIKDSVATRIVDIVGQ